MNTATPHRSIAVQSIIKFLKSIWLFPVLLLVMVCVLSYARINGSSVGMYHKLLYGTQDVNLLFGEPQPIRSDEWLVGTPFTVSQVNEDIPHRNKAIGNGYDASVLMDVPYRDWSEVFKIQNWPFFILPLEQAFAFKWWLMSYLLVVSVYFFVLTLLPKKITLAIFISLGLLASPFIQWWYLYGTLGTIYYSFFAAIISIHLLRANNLIEKIALSAALVYALSSFALILYPPFQIPCALAITALCAGLLFNMRLSWRQLGGKLLPFGIALIAVGLIIGAFVLTRQETVGAITGTVYPGHRIAPSGGIKPELFLDGSLQFQLKDLGRASHYFSNQSEDSNFIYIWPYLLIPSLFILARQWRNKKPDYALIFITFLLLLFSARMFLPLPEIISRIFFLNTIPNDRLKIGFGVLGIIQLILIIRALYHEKLHWAWAVSFGFIAFAGQMLVGLTLDAEFPLFGLRARYMFIAAFLIGLCVFLILKRKPAMSAAILLGLSLFTTVGVNPLYVGLGELTNSKLGRAAASTPGSETNGWAYVGNVVTMNLLQSQGLKSYSGTYPYPQLDYFKSLDPEDKYKNVYNRYGFAMFIVNDPKLAPFALQTNDSYFINYRPCEQKFKKDIKRVVSQIKLEDESCATLDSTVEYPKATYFIYSIR